jgi:hypothetical protein
MSDTIDSLNLDDLINDNTIYKTSLVQELSRQLEMELDSDSTIAEDPILECASLNTPVHEPMFDIVESLHPSLEVSDQNLPSVDVEHLTLIDLDIEWNSDNQVTDEPRTSDLSESIIDFCKSNNAKIKRVPKRESVDKGTSMDSAGIYKSLTLRPFSWSNVKQTKPQKRSSGPIDSMKEKPSTSSQDKKKGQKKQNPQEQPIKKTISLFEAFGLTEKPTEGNPKRHKQLTPEQKAEARRRNKGNFKRRVEDKEIKALETKAKRIGRRRNKLGLKQMSLAKDLGKARAEYETKAKPEPWMITEINQIREKMIGARDKNRKLALSQNDFQRQISNKAVGCLTIQEIDSSNVKMIYK